MTWSSVDNKPSDKIWKKGDSASVHIVRTVGAGAFSVQFQESNIGGSLESNWVDAGSAITSTGITKVTTATAQFVRIRLVIAPPADTTIKACLYADGIDE